MRSFYPSVIVCLLSATLVISCSFKKTDSSNVDTGKSIALGEITVDRCLFYTEGEDFKEKSGGDLDQKEAASKGKCLGIMWGGTPTDFVTYEINMEDSSESTIMVIRAAIQNPSPQSYNILIDDKVVQTATLVSTGGYGHTERQWRCFSIELGPIAKGSHTLTIRPSGNSGIVNIDCIALGRSE